MRTTGRLRRKAAQTRRARPGDTEVPESQRRVEGL